MSVFGAPFLITLPAASTSEVTGTMPAGTTGCVIVALTSITGAFQYPCKSVGFVTQAAQMAGGMNPMWRGTAGTQQGNAIWNNAAAGFGAVSGSNATRTITRTTWSGTTLGLTKNGTTVADVWCLVYPIIAAWVDVAEGTGINGTGTALNRTGLSGQPGALLYVSVGNNGNVALNGPRLNIGFATSPSSEWGAGVASVWDANPSNAYSRVLTDTMGPLYGLTSVYQGSQFNVSAMGATSYTIEQAPSSNQSNIRFAVMAIPGEFAILTGSVPSSTGTQANTSAPWRPSSALFALSALATANNVEADAYSLSVGGGTLATQRCGRIQGPDNTSTPQPSVADVTGAVMQGANASGQTSLATLQSFDANGLTLNWTDADATAGLWAALVSREAASGPSAAAIHDYLTLNGLTPGV